MIRLAFLVVLVGACGPSAKPAPVTPETPPVATDDDPSCPLLVAGTSITVEDSTEGPSFVFVTTGDVAQVRTRGAALAKMHNERSGDKASLGMMFSDASTATASDIDGGVRVTFVPKAPDGAGPVGDELRMHGGHLSGASSCKM